MRGVNQTLQCISESLLLKEVETASKRLPNLLDAALAKLSAFARCTEVAQRQTKLYHCRFQTLSAKKR